MIQKRRKVIIKMKLLYYKLESTVDSYEKNLYVYIYMYVYTIYVYVYIYIYLYVPDEGSLLPKYRDCTTSNDFESYLMCCGVMLQ